MAEERGQATQALRVHRLSKKEERASRSLNRCQRGSAQRDRIDGRPGDSPGCQHSRGATRGEGIRVSIPLPGSTYQSERDGLNKEILKHALTLRSGMMNRPHSTEAGNLSFRFKTSGTGIQLWRCGTIGGRYEPSRARLSWPQCYYTNFSGRSH